MITHLQQTIYQLSKWQTLHKSSYRLVFAAKTVAKLCEQIVVK